MKITTLLTQYLFNNQRLDLPGVGSFLLDSKVLDLPENSKQRNAAVLEGISFVNNPALAESPDLVAYISAQTGKMKALAAADLDSHIQLALQFLNIGKPFTFEGIGTLVQVKPKECEFTPISISPDRLREFQGKETTKSSQKEEGSAPYESFLSTPRKKGERPKQLVALLLICGLGLAVWGGYIISRRAAGKKQEMTASVIDRTQLVNDSLNKAAADSIAKLQESLANQNYKFVLQVSPRNTALKRYKQLKTNLWDVKMETRDSVQYKLFLLLPSLNADTTRIVDSLTVMTGKKVYIEHQN